MLRKTFVFATLLTAGLLSAGCEKKEKIVEIDATGPKGKEISVDVEKTPSGQVEVEVKKD
ncbi:MAG: hypothetical protein U0836_14125 [Pirellulales bacterium]